MTKKHGFDAHLYTRPLDKTHIAKLIKDIPKLYDAVKDKKIKRVTFWMEEL